MILHVGVKDIDKEADVEVSDVDWDCVSVLLSWWLVPLPGT